MKKLFFTACVIAVIIACSSTKTNAVATDKAAVSKNDTIRIANDELDYEIIIIEPGFDTWLASVAKPRNFYSLTYLETKNQFWVSEYNNRVLQPFRYNSNLYEMRIDYNPSIHYGYEVNYLLYNYFVYFQSHYRQKL
jgi:hypothetical protein